MTIQKMKEEGADEIMLETEISNIAALKLYESKLCFFNYPRFRLCEG
jgi:ribosomal protein S18 acetylase RimI-like enzyme